MFPSPREVYRFVSKDPNNLHGDSNIEFPSPLEVYRFISKGMYIGVTGELAKFLSPREVDRFISVINKRIDGDKF